MLLSLVSIAWGADPAAADELRIGRARPVQFAERTEIEFDSLLVDGYRTGPGVDLITDRLRPRFNPLIRLREDWTQELRWSIDDVK